MYASEMTINNPIGPLVSPAGAERGLTVAVEKIIHNSIIILWIVTL
jgi:hypothetical protein